MDTCRLLHIHDVLLVDGDVRTSIPNPGPTCDATYQYSRRLCRCYRSVIDAGERAALVALYVALNGPSTWISRTGWSSYASSSSDPCNDNWVGVTCADDPPGYNHIVGITVHGNNATGTLPSSVTALSALTSLDLSGNAIGSSLPAGLSQLTALVSLNLANNNLTGTLPSDLAPSSLTSLNLTFNGLHGSVPDGLSVASDLQSLSLANNRFSGALPATAMNALRALTSIDVTYNLLTSPVPAGLLARNPHGGFLGNCILEFPPVLYNCSDYYRMASQGATCTAACTLPTGGGCSPYIETNDAVDHFSSLGVSCFADTRPWGTVSTVDEPCYVSDTSNSLFGNCLGWKSVPSTGVDCGGSAPTTSRLCRCTVPTLPASEYNALLDLFVALNGPTWPSLANSGWDWQVGDPCVNSWAGVSCSSTSPRHIVSINLQSVTTSGTLPSTIGAFSTLTSLFLGGNGLTSTIPLSVSTMTGLSYLNLPNNHLSGSFPTAVSLMSNLRILNLASNSLGGTLPDGVSSLTALLSVDVSKNQLLHGTVTAGISTLTKLATLALGGNALSIASPSQLSTLTALLVLDVSNCNVAGAFPGVLSTLTKLTSLNMDGNALTGPVGSTIAAMSGLRLLRLGGNMLTAAAPISGLTNLQTLSLASNAIPDVPPVTSLTKLTYLDLSGNAMVGTFVASLTRLTALQYVDVSNNWFFDVFPSTLPTTLTHLDLSNNILSGSLPSTLSALTALRLFDASSNELTNVIPLALSSLTALTALYVHVRWSCFVITPNRSSEPVHVCM